jgi:hypothetical protein
MQHEQRQGDGMTPIEARQKAKAEAFAEVEVIKKVQAALKRMLSGDDGETIGKFIEHMAGITTYVPKTSLEMMEGLKRFNIVINRAVNSNQGDWIDWYSRVGKNIYSI